MNLSACLRLALHTQISSKVSCAIIARAFTQRAFLCLNFLQKEMSAVYAQESCRCIYTMFTHQHFSNIADVSQ